MTCGRAAGVNCAEILERLYEFVDQELDDDYWRKLQGHLEECAPCLRRVDFERLVKSLVARACCERAPVELRQRVLFAIRLCSQSEQSGAATSTSQFGGTPFGLDRSSGAGDLDIGGRSFGGAEPPFEATGWSGP